MAKKRIHKKKVKLCIQCKKNPLSGRQTRFCSHNCASAFWYKKHWKNTKRKYWNICLNPKCPRKGKPFPTSWSFQKYCTPKCKNAMRTYDRKYLKYVPKGKCPKCHGAYGTLWKITAGHRKSKRTRTYYYISHHKTIYIKATQKSTTKPIGVCYCGTYLPKI